MKTSEFDDFLNRQGILDGCERVAEKRVISFIDAKRERERKSADEDRKKIIARILKAADKLKW